MARGRASGREVVGLSSKCSTGRLLLWLRRTERSCGCEGQNEAVVVKKSEIGAHFLELVKGI